MAKKKDKSLTYTFAIVIILVIILVAGGIYFKNREPKATITINNETQTEKEIVDELLKRTITEPPTNESYLYSGLSFVYYDHQWYTKVFDTRTQQIYDLKFRHGPKELEDLELVGRVKAWTDALKTVNKTFVTFDPVDENLNYVTLANAELLSDLILFGKIDVQMACTANVSVCSEFPIINCTNTDAGVIYLKKADGAKIIEQNNCLILQGEGEDIVRSVNKFLYIWWGIM